MRKIYIFLFIIISACTTNNKVYICGDHPCKDKKEVESYFKDNISMEVYVFENQKKAKKNEDLVNLNLFENQKLNEKKNNLDFLNKRKDKINTSKNDQKPAKLKLIVKTDHDKKISINKARNAQTNSKFTYKKLKSKKIIHMCKNFEECDIDLISKRISEMSQKETFPDINF